VYSEKNHYISFGPLKFLRNWYLNRKTKTTSYLIKINNNCIIAGIEVRSKKLEFGTKITKSYR